MNKSAFFQKAWLLGLLLATTIMACSNNREVEQQEALRSDIFAIHDEVMPKTSDINRYIAELRQLIGRDSVADPTFRAEVYAAISQLEKADDGMMRWMNDFRHPDRLRDSLSHEQIMAYLSEQKVQIQQVRDAMLGSIETAKKILNDK